MNDLVINHKGTLATTQSTVSELTDNNEQSVQKLIRTYEADLKEFGELEFKNELIFNSKNKINYKKVYCLNEQQATLLLTYMKNTPKVREAKKILVKAFYDMRQELQALKFQRYVDEIADLNACLIDKTKRHKKEIATYKGKLTMAKNQLAEFNDPKFKPFTSSHLSYMELFKEYIGVLGNNNALKIRADGLSTMLKEARNERDYFRNKYNEIYKILKTDKNKEIVLNLAKIQKELEKNYTAIGAVMSFVNDDDRYFLENNEITKG